jgi:hypothetical protein
MGVAEELVDRDVPWLKAAEARSATASVRDPESVRTSRCCSIIVQKEASTIGNERWVLSFPFQVFQMFLPTPFSRRFSWNYCLLHRVLDHWFGHSYHRSIKFNC